ncbi:MAG: sugar ABC transporter permease [Gemmatimonadetes bacterium]|nr:sugar ABC transporter permease [Gemmatimonadota bacterium]
MSSGARTAESARDPAGPDASAGATAKRARISIIAFVLIPLAIALAIPVERIGAGARAESRDRLRTQADSAAAALREARLASPAGDPARAARGVLAMLDAPILAAWYDAASGWTAPAAYGEFEWPAVLDAAIVDELAALDRSLTVRIRGRTAAVAPVKDGDEWDVVGAIALVRGAPEASRVPLVPAAIAVAGWLLTALFALGSVGRPGAHVGTGARRATRKRARTGTRATAWLRAAAWVAPFAPAAVLARWPGPGTHGLWTVLALSGWAVFAWIGFGLATIAYRPLAAREAHRAWAFLAPSFAHLLVFSIGPILFSLWLSFHEWDLLEPVRPFVGLDNYRALAGDADFLRALRNTAVYVLFVPVGMIVALGLALFVDRRIPGVRLLRTTFFLPYVTSFVAISLVWRWMYQPDIGLINQMLERVGIPAQPWLSSPATAMPSLMLMSIWMYAGYMMVLFLAGLQSIPATLYESARIDGASAWQRFRRITLPLLRPTTLFVLVTMIIFMFQVFTAVYIMTEGGPLHATDVIVYHIYRNAWEYLRMGYASAMAWVLFAIVFVVTLVQLRWLETRNPV